MITIEDACLRYLEEREEFLGRTAGMEAVGAYQRASDGLLGAFADGIPDERLFVAWRSFRQALVQGSTTTFSAGTRYKGAAA